MTPKKTLRQLSEEIGYLKDFIERWERLTDNPDGDMSELTEEYISYTDEHKLPPMSADELLCQLLHLREDLTNQNL